MQYSSKRQIIWEKVQEIEKHDFEILALNCFRFQAEYNPVYRQYLNLLKISPQTVQDIDSIPFLPISTFKNHIVKTANWREEAIFESSGTSGQVPSRHYVKHLNNYFENAKKGFESFYGDVSGYCFLALLPSYLERGSSSLVAMTNYFIGQSSYEQSGFFLYNLKELTLILDDCKRASVPTVLLGVSYALLDLAERFPKSLGNNMIIMETGGMKGRRKEIIRKELQKILKNAFQVKSIHSEYGMTELFSQAYSQGEGIFFPTPTMKILSKEISDPLASLTFGKTGMLNIIDLANIDSCCFIGTEDLGKVNKNGFFEVLGRLDHSDMRGCNLLLKNF